MTTLLSCPLVVSAQQGSGFSGDQGPDRYSLRGTAINSVTGEPLPRVLVRLEGETRRTTLTDSNGHFQFDNLPEMNATIVGEKPGFQDEHDLSSAQTEASEIHVAGFTKELQIRMMPESVAEGRVTNSDGDPLERVPVRLVCERGTKQGRIGEPCGNAFTDEDGEFRFDNLAAGSYLLEAGPSASYGVRRSIIALDLASGEHARADLSLEADARAVVESGFAEYREAKMAIPNRIPIASVPGTASIRGIVLNTATQEPLPGTEVVLAIPNSRSPLRTMVTENSGHFAFSGAAPGTYLLMTRRKDFRPQGSHTGQPVWTRVTVGEESNSSNLVFFMQPDAFISGKVTDQENESVRDAQVILFRRTQRRSGKKITHLQDETTTNGAGFYRFSHLAPGEYFVAILAQPWYAQHNPGASSDLDVAYPVVFNSSAADAAEVAPIDLRPGDHDEEDVIMRPVPSLHLVVSSGNPDNSWPVTATLMAPLYGGFATPVPSESMTVNGDVIEISGVAAGHYVISLQSYGGEAAGYRRKELDLFSDMEIDGTLD